MFPGHFAACLALKTAEPRASTLGLMVAAGFLDLVFGVAVVFGLEGGGFGHFNTPWSHSLLMAVVWSALFAACFFRSGQRVALVMFAAVMSHWVLDVVSHHRDMQMWPHSAIAIGYGPLFGGLGGWLELLVSVAGTGAYVVWARRPENGHRRWDVVAAVIAVAYAAEVFVVRGR